VQADGAFCPLPCILYTTVLNERMAFLTGYGENFVIAAIEHKYYADNGMNIHTELMQIKRRLNPVQTLC
jgi:hypothetical protein